MNPRKFTGGIIPIVPRYSRRDMCRFKLCSDKWRAENGLTRYQVAYFKAYVLEKMVDYLMAAGYSIADFKTFEELRSALSLRSVEKLGGKAFAKRRKIAKINIEKVLTAKTPHA